jgi:hypothetical protein
MIFANFPSSIFSIISSYIPLWEFNNFLNSSNCYFKLIKFENRKICLSAEETRLFIENTDFRRQILAKIANPLHQLIISIAPVKLTYGLDVDHQWIQLLEALREIICREKLKFYKIKLLSGTRNLRNGVSAFCIDFFFENVLNVEAIMNYGKESFMKSGSSFNYSCQIMKKAIVDGVLVGDLSDFSCVKDLTILNCWHYSKFSPFTSLIRLSIINCNGLVDVSPFHSIRYLKLETCSSVSDISSLTNNYSVTIILCLKITCFDSLSNCKRLVLQTATTVTDLKTFYAATHLSISSTKLSKVRILPENLRSVHLLTCNKVTNLKGLSSLYHVVLEDCDSIEDVTALSKVNYQNCLFYLLLKDLGKRIGLFVLVIVMTSMTFLI